MVRVKSIPVEELDRQTLLILPPSFLRRFSPEHRVTFQEVAVDVLMLTMVGPGGFAQNKPYKLVTSKGSTWVSIPRDWLRNLGAKAGDELDLYAVPDPDFLLLKFRRT